MIWLIVLFFVSVGGGALVTAVCGVVKRRMASNAQKALEPSYDQKIVLALKEGTLTDDDLRGIGIDPDTFRDDYRRAERHVRSVESW